MHGIVCGKITTQATVRVSKTDQGYILADLLGPCWNVEKSC